MPDAKLEPRKGRVTVVTGGASGIGRFVSERLAGLGYRVVICDLARHELDPRIAFYECDVRHSESVDATFQRIAIEHEDPAILINCAGVLRTSWIADTSDEAWNDVIGVNLTGSFNCTRAVVPAMHQSEFGRIVYVTSITATRGEPRTSAYAASKGGLIGLTRALAPELARSGITVNAIAPGYVLTPQTESVFVGETKESVLGQIPMKRFGSPSDISGVFELLVGDQGSYITGQVIAIDGGVS